MSAEPTPSPTPAPSIYRVADLCIDVQLRRVSREGVDLPLSGRTFDLLVALVRAAPGLVSIEALLEAVWPGVVVGVETVTQRIKLLRQALGDNAESPRYIVAVRGHGYRLLTAAVPLAAPGDSSSDSPGRSTGPAVAAPDSAGADAAPMRGGRGGLAAAAVLCVLVAAGGAAWWRVAHPRRSLAAPPASAVSVRGARLAIAVMPFANRTGDPSKDYFADGMAEELIAALNRVPGLHVPSSSSTFAYKGHAASPQTVARDLGVSTLLDGGVESAGERIRVSARLIDAATGMQLWSGTYDRPLAEIFKLQDDVAADALQALRGRAKVDWASPVPRPEARPDVQAYELYLQARATGHGTPESELKALGLVNQALARDPVFADALAYRAFIEAGSVGLGSGPATGLESANRDASRALEQSPHLALAHVALGIIRATRGEWVDAAESFRSAIEADPADPFARNLHAMYVLKPAGRLREAQAELKVSYRLAPEYGFTLNELTLVSSLLGLDQEMDRLARLNLEIDQRPAMGDVRLAYARADARSSHYAQATQQAAAALPPPLRVAQGTAVVQSIYAARRDPARRPAALASLERLEPTLRSAAADARTRSFFLEAYVELGALDSAYALAAQFLDARPETRWNADWSDLWQPEMRAFRGDPRFQGLVTRIGLMPYWMRYGPPDECDLHGGALTCR